jgi:hypothetical protein
MNFDLLTKIISANPEKALDVLSKAIDLVKESPLLQTALAKWLEAQGR